MIELLECSLPLSFSSVVCLGILFAHLLNISTRSIDRLRKLQPDTRCRFPCPLPLCARCCSCWNCHRAREPLHHIRRSGRPYAGPRRPRMRYHDTTTPRPPHTPYPPSTRDPRPGASPCHDAIPERPPGPRRDDLRCAAACADADADADTTRARVRPRLTPPAQFYKRQRRQQRRRRNRAYLIVSAATAITLGLKESTIPVVRRRGAVAVELCGCVRACIGLGFGESEDTKKAKMKRQSVEFVQFLTPI